jgi:protein involved in polysaccharide export with SLBB domain
MLKDKLIFILALVILPFICFSQAVDQSILENIQVNKKTPVYQPKPIDSLAERKSPAEKPESLSTIEKMFNEKYMVTPRRMKIELMRDSLSELVKAESLKIELRRSYLVSDSLQTKYLITADTTYFNLRKKLNKANKQLDSLSVTLKQFGYDMFYTRLQEIPVFAPVADNYILGPGDELYIDISGEINNSWIMTINRDGSIVLPYIGNINLWGNTYAESKKIISESFEQEFSNIEVSVSLGYLKSVNVFVMGEFNTPGIYDITVLSNPLSPLFRADGPKKSGSLRKIKYISNNGTTKVVDLYKLLIKGQPLSFLQLSDGDIILVPPIGKVVGIDGDVNRSGIYELTDGEQLSALIEMAGGLLPTAGKKRIMLERISPDGRKIVEDITFVNQSDLESISRSTKLENGDLVSVLEMPPYLHNYVEISGNVNSEGNYALKEGMTVLDLIEEAGGLRKGTYLERAELLRFTGVENPEIIEINLKDLYKESSEENIRLNEWDKLRIFKIDEVEEKFFVRIAGEIANPGVYPLNPSMEVEDLLFIARPLISSQNKAELFRINPDEGVYVEKIDITNAKDLKIALKPDDYLLIHKKQTYREIGHVLLEGEFNSPGLYDIKEGTTLGKLIDIAGGFTENAYLEGTIFTKKSVRKLQDEALDDLVKETRMRLLAEQRAIMGSITSEDDKLAQIKYIQIQEQQLESLKKLKNPGRVVINLKDPSQLNIPLENGDELKVPRLTGTVQVIGEVYNSTGIAYEEGLSLNDYLRIAGGPKPTADVKEIYIRRASGEVEKGKIRSASGKMGGSVKIKPGDTIIVPEKVRIGRSGWEVLAFTVDILYKVGLAVAAVAAITN